MKKFKVTFTDIIEGVENEEEAYDILLDYLDECAENGDVTAFDFEEVKE